MDHGHPEARRYPLGMLWDESNLVIERVNATMITEANLLQYAVHGVLSKKSRDVFQKIVKSLNVETRPFDEAQSERLLPEDHEED